MTFHELCIKRQSTRSFSERPLDTQSLREIAECVRLSPSAVNAQPYDLVIAQGEAARAIGRARGPYNAFIEKAPCFAVFLHRTGNRLASIGSKWMHTDFRRIDTGIAAATLCYAAEERGIGTCILGIYKEKMIQQSLGTNQEVLLVVALGYPEDGYALRPKKRRPPEDFVRFAD